MHPVRLCGGFWTIFFCLVCGLLEKEKNDKRLFFEHLVLACTIILMNDLCLLDIDNLLEILILILRNFRKLPTMIWSIQAIPTYQVYRLYDMECTGHPYL